MIAEKTRETLVPGAHFICVGLARQRRGGEAVADLDPFYRVDGHHRHGEVGIELAVDGRAEPGRYAARHHLNHRADRGAGLANGVEIIAPLIDDAGIGRPERVVVDLIKAGPGAVDLFIADLDQIAGDLHLVAKDFAGNAARRDARRRLARARAAAAAVIADAVFCLVGVIGVAGAEFRLDVPVIRSEER